MATEARNILIVDDDNTVAYVYQRHFHTAGYEVDVAGTGEKAIASLKIKRPALVLLDLQLPGVSGIDVLKFIRAEAALKDLPVVVFSNAYLGNLVQAAWSAGATKCLTKAICTPKQVLEVIKVTLAKTAAPVPAAPFSAESPASTAAILSAPAPTCAAPASSREPEADDAFMQAEISQAFLDESGQMQATMRGRLQALAKVETTAGPRIEEERSAILYEFYQLVHQLSGKAAVAGFRRMASLSSAFEVLVRELHEKPKRVNASTIRTMASTVDFFSVLLEQTTRGEGIAPEEAAILVVDDDPVSRRSVVAGLEKGCLNATSVEDPLVALAKLAKTPYDLIFLDVQMPVMNGFEVCTRLRAMPLHAKTPVVFVTSMTDFQSRARSTLSGGNDLIAKPFLLIELAVKALTYVLRGKVP